MYVHVWISYAQFESSIENIEGARLVFERAERYFRIEADSDTATEEVKIFLCVFENFQTFTIMDTISLFRFRGGESPKKNQQHVQNFYLYSCYEPQKKMGKTKVTHAPFKFER